MSTPSVDFIATMNPKIMREQLDNPNSPFYENTKLAPDAPLVQKLKNMLKGGDRYGPEMQHKQSLDSLGITLDELRGLGKGVFNLYFKFGTRDKDGKELVLDAPEFMGWQGTTPEAQKESSPAPDVTADVWAARIDAPLKSRATVYTAGDQRISIETPAEKKRLYSVGRLSIPFDNHYGYISITDADPKSPTKGQPIIYGGDGELDVYLPDRVLDQVKQGKPYHGNVIVMAFDKGSTHDAKVFFTDNPNEVIRNEQGMYAKSDNDPTVSEAAGLKFDKQELPASLLNRLQSIKAQYVTMTDRQFQAWQYALSEHQELRDVRLDTWIGQTFGSKEKFDALFASANGSETLSREEYHAVMQRLDDSKERAIPVQQRIQQAAKAFAKADYASWTAEVPEAFSGPSDALFFGNDKTKPVAPGQLPKNEAGIEAWIKAQPSLKDVYATLKPDEQKQAVDYVQKSLVTRAAKDALQALPNGETIRATIDRQIEKDYDEGKRTSKFKQGDFNAAQYLDSLTDEATGVGVYKRALKFVQEADKTEGAPRSYPALSELAGLVPPTTPAVPAAPVQGAAR